MAVVWGDGPRDRPRCRRRGRRSDREGAALDVRIRRRDHRHAGHNCRNVAGRGDDEVVSSDWNRVQHELAVRIWRRSLHPNPLRCSDTLVVVPAIEAST